VAQPLLSLTDAEIRAYAVAMARIANDVCLERRLEEGTSERITDRLTREVFATGALAVWVADVLDKYVEEPALGADLAFLLVDPTVQDPRIVKAAFIQAKNRPALTTTQAVCELDGQCRTMIRVTRGGSWVWLYDDDGPRSTSAASVARVVETLSTSQPPCPCTATNPPRYLANWTASPMINLRAQEGSGRIEHEPEDWFDRLLRCTVSARMVPASTQRALTRLRPTVVVILGRRDQLDPTASALEGIVPHLYRRRPLHLE
jgi:hypothetical protein